MRVSVDDVELLDAEGDRVPAAVTFIAGFAHSLYPPTREPTLSDSEQERLGRLARIEPGRRMPFTVSWRLEPGGDPPVRISYGRGYLLVPGR
jgi:hypothetical protein